MTSHANATSTWARRSLLALCAVPFIVAGQTALSAAELPPGPPGGGRGRPHMGNPAGGLPFTLVFNADGSINRKILGEIQPDDLNQTLSGLKA